MGKKLKRRDHTSALGSKLPSITPTAKCKLRLLKLERVKDWLLMEEEFVQNQERLKPADERNEEERTKVGQGWLAGWLSGVVQVGWWRLAPPAPPARPAGCSRFAARPVCLPGARAAAAAAASIDTPSTHTTRPHLPSYSPHRQVDDLRGTPLSVGTLEEMIDENHAIVSSAGERRGERQAADAVPAPGRASRAASAMPFRVCEVR